MQVGTNLIKYKFEGMGGEERGTELTGEIDFNLISSSFSSLCSLMTQNTRLFISSEIRFIYASVLCTRQ